MKTYSRPGSITLGDLLAWLVGVTIALGVLTYLRIAELKRMKGEVRGPLPYCAQERAEHGDDRHADLFKQSAPPDALLDGVEVFQSGGSDAVGKHAALGTLARDHAASDEALGDVYVVVGQRLYHLAPVSDEEFKKLSASAVGIFGSIGSHAENHTTPDNGKATAK